LIAGVNMKGHRMKITISLLAAALLASATGTASVAQEQAGAPRVGIGSKTMGSCKEDIRKLCSTATEPMQKECLVKNWMKISNDCQDAVAKPGREGGG
jgi:hypothetical protein